MAATPEIHLSRLWKVAPLTAGAVIGAVIAMRALAVATLRPSLRIEPLIWSAPVLFSVILISGAVLAFVLVVMMSTDPIRTYRRVAFVVIVLSCIPDLTLPGPDDPRLMETALTLGAHVLIWWITIGLLTSLSRPTRRNTFVGERS